MSGLGCVTAFECKFKGGSCCRRYKTDALAVLFKNALANGQTKSGVGGGTNYLEQIDEWIKADHSPDPEGTERKKATESAAQEPVSPEAETAPEEEKQEVETP